MVKKNYLKIVLIVALIFISAFMLLKAYAAAPKYLEITREREGNQAYKITNLDPNKTIWKIVQYDSMDVGATINYDEAIYCINPEIGFGADGDVGPLRREYNVSFNMKDLTDVDEIYTNMFSDTNKYNYNALLWIIDNLYLPKQTPEADRIAMKQLLLSEAGITRDVLTDNDIETVQQLALWYYATEASSVYHFEPENFPSISIVDTTDESEIAIEEIGQPLENTGIQRKNDMVTLYTYLIESALTHAPEYGTGDVRALTAPNIEIAKPVGDTVAQVEEINDTDYFVSGPFNFDETTSTQLPYSFSAAILNQDEEEITGYILLDSTKAVMAENDITEALEGQDFYIAIPTTETEIEKVKFKVDLRYFTTEVSCWTNSDTYLVEQPVVIVEKDPHILSEEVEVRIEQPEFDLSLRKFITKVNGAEITNRIPTVDVTGLINGTSTTAVYTHPKNPVVVKNGDIVTYTIRVYNEGDLDGYVKEITDSIPEGLEFIIDNPVNIEYMWRLAEDETKISTNYLSREKDEANLILAFDSEDMSTLHFKEVQVAFKVIEPNSSERILTNIAEITDDSDGSGQNITDRDSTPGNLVETEDDIDEEHLRLEFFDLALRKFITKVNETNVTNRVPVVSMGEDNNLQYTHTKTPVLVSNDDIVIYTIRVYNEGTASGYAKEVTDDIPEGLSYLPEHDTNKEYGWVLSEDGRKIATTYLSKQESEEREEDNLLKGFDKSAAISDEEGNQNPDYRDIKIAFKVAEENPLSERIIINTAEITDDSDENGNDVTDVDSTPDNGDEDEDDIDKEYVKVRYFDLALRKFITKVNNTDVTDRIPVVSVGEDGNLNYEHKKDPVLVANNNIVIYTIRVYNEGSTSGYAEEVADDIPEGLSYLPEHDKNKEYGWILSEDGKKVSTTYLSKQESEEREEDNLLKGFDKSAAISDEEGNQNPDYRDLKIAFKVTEKNLPTARIIINTAEITDDGDEDGNDVTDIDSTPNNGDESEDDIDKEYLEVKYFDLALLKWVSKVIITEDGKTTVKDTGHTGLENPEPIVKVDLDRKKLSKITVKFAYTIKITNEGEIAGYAKEVSDYIPEGLEFVKEDNPKWEEKDGKIVTRALEDTLLQPGESATVEVILKWKNSADNLGLKINVAEISEDDNEDDAKDIDSTPNNKKEGEDDIDDAPVMLSVKTGGNAPVYYTLSTVILFMIGSGVFLIKKYVLG